MSLVQQAQQELATRGSRSACASEALADGLKAAVLSAMAADSTLTFASVAASTGTDSSALRKWLVGARMKVRSGGTKAAGLSLGKAVLVAQWLSAEAPEPEPKVTGADFKFNAVVESETSSVRGLL